MVQGQFFPFFIVTVAGLVTIPVTYSLLRKSTGAQPPNPLNRNPLLNYFRPREHCAADKVFFST